MSQSIPKLMTWMTFLVIGSMALSLTVSIAIIAAASGLHVIVATIILTGSVVTSWITGAVVIGMGTVISKSKDHTTVKNLSLALLVVGIIFVIATIAAGIDLTRLFTSPVRLLGKFGNVFTRLISKSGAGPKALQGVQGESILNAVGRVGASIAVVQLIGILPFPFNVLLFFLYYKFVTGIIFCGIPTGLAIWAFSQIYAFRKEVIRRENEYRTLDDSDSDSSIQSVQNLEAAKLLVKKKKKTPELPVAKTPLKTTATGQVVIDASPSKNNQVHTANHIQTYSPPHTSPKHRHVDYKSSELYPNV